MYLLRSIFDHRHLFGHDFLITVISFAKLEHTIWSNQCPVYVLEATAGVGVVVVTSSAAKGVVTLL